MKKFLLLLAMLAMPAISSSIMAASAGQKKFDYDIDSGSWYDIDGDGKMEWISSGNLYRFTEDNTGQTLITERFAPKVNTSRYYWNNFGREDKIDLLVSRTEKTTDSWVYKVEDNVASVLFSVDASLSRLDYNNDGHTDLWIKNSKISQRDQEVVTFGPSGEIRNEFIHIMSPAEYYDYWIAHPSLGIGPGISIVSPNYNDPPGSFGDYSQIDLNNDGYLDFIDMESGTYLLNLGNGYFVSDSMGGSVLFRDFDGDGLNDQFLYSKTDKSISVFLQREGEAEKVELFKGLACGNDIWCRDFDKDGDIDILVPFNAPDNKGSSYLLMFENNGNGSFRKHEYYVEGANMFLGCADVDADGNYEVIAGEYSKSPRAVSIYNLKGIDVNTTGKYICECEGLSSGYSKCLIGDPANRGNLSLLIGNTNPRIKDYFQSKMDFYHFEGVNTPPARPVAPEVDYDPLAGTVKVSWELGSDKETAPLDLTYELRIGTAPDKGDILWADALPDGTRRRLGSGNTSYGRVRCFDANYWPEGKIYVSLQVVDDNGKGSPFSEYAVFEKKMPPVGFTVSGPEITAVNDTVTLSLLAPSSASYTWDCDGGTVISQTDTSVSLVWKTPGIKKVRLHAVAMSGSKSELMREVEVFPARIKQVMEDYPRAAFDMDGDGSMELLSNSQSLYHFLEGDTDGVYTPVKRLFNSNLPTIVSARIADIDRDGRPDVISKTHQLINRGDKDMDVNEVKNGYYLSCDLDNDGCMDVSYQLRNSGNYIDFIETGNSEIYGGIKYYDYDNDGLTDIIRAYDRNFEIYKNYGGFKFSLLEKIDLDDRIYNDDYSIGDVDGNGYADIVWTSSKNAPAVHVRWNDGQSADIDAPEGYRIYNVGLFDFDNNGTHDLFLSLDNGSDNPYLAYAIAFFNPDRTWNMVKYMNNEQDPLTYIYISMIYHRTDGRLGIFRNAIFGPENTPPTPPQNLRVERNEDYIVVEWDPASDAENPSAALKYNISIKYKDKDGEGAYFISPLNYGRNGVHVPAESTLINGTKFTIPLDVMPVGKLEIKVQAVDTQWQESDFSEPLEYEFECIPFLSIPDATMVGKETQICLRTGISVEDVDFGPDAEVLSSTRNLISVRWSTEGYKIVSCNGYEVRVLVHPAFDASFSIPEKLYNHDRVLIECDNTHNSSWSYNHFEGTTFWPMEEGTLFEIDDNHVEVLAISTALPMWIKHTLTEDYGTAEYICVTHIKDHPVPIGPSDIFRDYESGNNVVCWTVPEHLVDKAIGVNVYKKEYDGEKYVEKKIASLPIDIAHFIDMDTNPNPLYWEYYGISYVYPYGESQKSDMETPMLLSVYLNEDGDWVLTWSHAYEDIECYQILRGTSPDDLYPLDWVDYAQQRYTDKHTFGQQYYYQVMALKERNNLESVFRRSNIVLSPEHPAGEESILSGNDGITVAYDRGESKCHISGMPEGNGKQTVVEIYNLNGADLFHATFETSTATIDLSHLPDGIYILRAVTGSSVVTERFIKHGQ